MLALLFVFVSIRTCSTAAVKGWLFVYLLWVVLPLFIDIHAGGYSLPH